MESELNNQQPGPIEKSQPEGCSGMAAFIVLSIWIILISLIAQVTHWTVWQMIFEGSIKLPNVRWIIELTYGILLLIPLVIAVKIVREPIARGRLIALLNLSILAILLSPARLPAIYDWQLTAVIELGVIVIFIVYLAFINRGKIVTIAVESKQGIGFFLLAVTTGAILGIPWVVWGAQGSLTDTILALFVACSIGYVTAAVLLSPNTRELLEGQVNDRPRGIGGAGWTVTLGLIILATSVDQNGNGWLLLCALLPLGYILATLAYGLDGKVTTQGRIAVGVLAAFTFLWPMMMFDPDELSFVISSGAGELFEYAAGAAGAAFGLAFILMVIYLIFRKMMHTKSSAWIAGVILTIPALTGLLISQISFGNPGFYGEKSFVILKDQADLSSVKTITNPVERREAVYSALVKHAEANQMDIRSWLDSKGIAFKPYYLINAIELDAGPVLRAQLAQRNDVDRVLDSPILRPLRNEVPTAKGSEENPIGDLWNLSLIGADKVHDDLNVYGEGVIVGQSDSGMQGDHPEISGQYRGEIDGMDDYNWYDPWNGSKKPVDIGGHGTHTLGSIVGKNVGVAPKAEWIGCVNLARNLGNPAYYLDCMQFMLAPFPQDGDPFKDGEAAKGANVLNNSWGCPAAEGCDPETFIPAVKALKDAGVFVVASAGNTGYGGCSSIQDPLALYEDVYTVGAIDKNRNLAGFSSVGPVTVDGSGRVKPDIGAPGVDVISSFPGSTYESASGTSMAGPHVVGVVSLMWSANPSLVGNVDKTIEILNETADVYKGVFPGCELDGQQPNNAVGYGIVNAYKAVQKAIEIR